MAQIKDFYTNVAEVSSLAAGASATAIVKVEADASFVLVKMAYFADIAGAAQTDSSRVIPLVNVEFTDSGSGRNLQSSAVPISSLCGDGALPFILPIPRRFQANSNIAVKFTNYSAATPYDNVRIALIGYKEFTLG